MIKIEEFELNRLQKISKIAKFAGLGGIILLLIIYLFTYSEANRKILNFNEVLEQKQKEVNSKQVEVNSMQAEVNSMQAEVNSKQVEVNRKNEEIANRNGEITNQLNLIEVQKKTLADNEAKIREQKAYIKASKPTVDVPARIFIQIGEAAQRTLAVKLKQKLEAAGYIVPDIDNVAGKARMPANTELRFCKGREQANDIKNITALLAEEKISLTVHAPLTTPGCDDVSSNRNYELWLKNN